MLLQTPIRKVEFVQSSQRHRHYPIKRGMLRVAAEAESIDYGVEEHVVRLLELSVTAQFICPSEHVRGG